MPRRGTKANPFEIGEEVMFKDASVHQQVGRVASVRTGDDWGFGPNPVQYEVQWEDARWPTKHVARDLVAAKEAAVKLMNLKPVEPSKIMVETEFDVGFNDVHTAFCEYLIEHAATHNQDLTMEQAADMVDSLVAEVKERRER